MDSSWAFLRFSFPVLSLSLSLSLSLVKPLRILLDASNRVNRLVHFNVPGLDATANEKFQCGRESMLEACYIDATPRPRNRICQIHHARARTLCILI